jgi:hypothetical protein
MFFPGRNCEGLRDFLTKLDLLPQESLSALTLFSHAKIPSLGPAGLPKNAKWRFDFVSKLCILGQVSITNHQENIRKSFYLFLISVATLFALCKKS